MSVTVIAFTTLDGVVEDPDGAGGTPLGGWMFRYGPEAVEGDKFRLGATLDDGVLLLGRRTWEGFAKIWPARDDPFSTRMNTAAKLVASRSLTDTSAWGNSRVLAGDLVEAVRAERRDVVVAGSLSVVRALAAADLVDEYRLSTFPTVLGTGERLFPAGGDPIDLELLSVDRVGAATLTRYRRVGGPRS